MFRFFTNRYLPVGQYVAVDADSVSRICVSDHYGMYNFDDLFAEGIYTEGGTIFLNSDFEETDYIEITDSYLRNDLSKFIAASKLEDIRFPMMQFWYDPDQHPTDDQWELYGSDKLIETVFFEGFLPNSDADYLFNLENTV